MNGLGIVVSRKAVEDDVAIALYRDPGAVRGIDISFLRGSARRFAELIDLAPTLARDVGVIWYISHVTRYERPRARREMHKYVTWLHRTARERGDCIAQLEDSVAALSDHRRPPAWERHLRRAQNAT